MRLILIITSFGLLTACGGTSSDTTIHPATAGISTPSNVSAIPSQ